MNQLLAEPALKFYTVYPGDTYSEPQISGSAGESVDFNFSLSESWKQLYTDPDNSTHKIAGVVDIFQRNSLRLGVRRAETEQPGLVAVAYTHKKGKYTYPALKDSTGKAIILRYDIVYSCSIYKAGPGWIISLYDKDRTQKFGTMYQDLTIGSFLRRLSGIYIELKNRPCPWLIQTRFALLHP